MIIQGEPNYNFECEATKSVTKRNKSLRNVKLQIVIRGVEVKQKKIKDVLKLLTLHYGENWMENIHLQ